MFVPIVLLLIKFQLLRLNVHSLVQLDTRTNVHVDILSAKAKSNNDGILLSHEQ